VSIKNCFSPFGKFLYFIRRSKFYAARKKVHPDNHRSAVWILDKKMSNLNLMTGDDDTGVSFTPVMPREKMYKVYTSHDTLPLIRKNPTHFLRGPGSRMGRMPDIIPGECSACHVTIRKEGGGGRGRGEAGLHSSNKYSTVWNQVSILQHHIILPKHVIKNAKKLFINLPQHIW
jgi:hypothetical protein